MTEATQATAAPAGEHAAESAAPGDDTSVLGAIHIKNDVVAKIAAYLAAELPDVGGPTRGLSRLPGGDALGSGRADLGRQPAVSAQVHGGRAYLDLAASIRWPASVARVTADLQRHLRQRIRELTGLEVDEVRIEVADLITETPTRARVS